MYSDPALIRKHSVRLSLSDREAVKKVLTGATKAFQAHNNSKAARFLGVSPDWLATGKGQKSRESDQTVEVKEDRPVSPAVAVQTLVSALSNMAPDARLRASSLLNNLINDPAGPWAGWLVELLSSGMNARESGKPPATDEQTAYSPAVGSLPGKRPVLVTPTRPVVKPDKSGIYALGEFIGGQPTTETKNVRHTPKRGKK